VVWVDDMRKSVWNRLVFCVLILAVGVLLVSVTATVLSVSSQPQVVAFAGMSQPNVMWINEPAPQGMLPHIIGFANVSGPIQVTQPNVMYFTVLPPPQIIQPNNMMFTTGPPGTTGSEWFVAASGAITISYVALITIILAVAVIASTGVYLIGEIAKSSTTKNEEP